MDDGEVYVHSCSVCGRLTDRHDTNCYLGQGEPHTHTPSLCCIGCLCLSVDEAHPDAVGTPTDTLLSPLLVGILRRNAIYTLDALEDAPLTYLRSLRGIGRSRFLDLVRARVEFRKTQGGNVMREPTSDQSYCDVGRHQECSGYTEDEADPETCMCLCHGSETS